VGTYKKEKILGNKMQNPTQWLKWRCNAYLLAKMGVKMKSNKGKS
jgi:hypothetical protein